MKKALVIAFMMVLGLGLFASAQTWEGTWDTDISINPSAAVFSDFIGFDSDLTVTMSVGGWEFSMDADFSVGGMDGLGFDAEGVIGAFSFDIDLDFEPMLLSSVATVYTDLSVQTGSCLADKFTWTYGTKTVTSTYGPAFDDLTVEGSVNIAGLSFGGLFYLKGTDMDATNTYSTWVFAGIPKQFSVASGPTTAPAATTLPVLGTTKVGTGAKFTISGSFAGATVTNYTYFNLKEYSYNYYMANIAEVRTYIADSLLMSGTLQGLECEGCNVMFTRNYTLIEGLVPFGDCLTVDIAIDFSCCDFEGISILFTDISLGCCWDLSFDFLIEFDTISKTMTLEPEMTFANACFTIDAEVTYSSENVISGIELEGLSYSHAFNGVTVSFAATWDYSDNPLISWNSAITHYGASKVYFWKPDTHTGLAAVTDQGVGNYVLASEYCTKEVATVINKLSLDFDADGCCGGLFDLDVDTYFGDIKAYTLVDIYGTYYYATSPAATWTEVDFLGSDNQYTDFAGKEDPTLSWTAADTDVCNPCPADAVVFKDSLKLFSDWGTGTTLGSMLGWVETDADIVFGVGSNISIGLGLDVAWWGWESISFSIEFTW